MPPRVLFVADTHWHHRATLGPRLGLNRPFATIEEHDEVLVERWNAAVCPATIKVRLRVNQDETRRCAVP